MMLALACTLLVLLFVLPFAPGFREFRKKQDAAPLYVNMDYQKYPRYFASSFRRLFIDSLKDPSAREGHRELMLSKREQVRIVEHAEFTRGAISENVLYVLGDLESEKNVTFDKEVYVQGTARIGADNRLQALACDGDIHIQQGARFSRWLDAEGNITAESSCSLGVDATCGGTLSVEHACTFMRLFGSPVSAGAHAADQPEDDEPDNGDMPLFRGETVERNLSSIPALTLKNNSLISTDSLSIGEFSVIRGHIKTHRNLIIGANVTITGNIFAEGDIEIGPSSRVLGTVFSQERIIVKHGVRIGSKGRVKSVIGKKGVVMEQGVRVYGLVMTEGKGSVI